MDESLVPVRTVDLLEFERVLATSETPTIVFFTTPSCTPCRWMEVEMLELERRYAGVIELLRVDVELVPDLVDRFELAALPVVLLITGSRGRRSVERMPDDIIGYQTADDLESRLRLTRFLGAIPLTVPDPDEITSDEIVGNLADALADGFLDDEPAA